MNDRQFLLLTAIPFAPKSITTDEVVLRLREAGHVAHRRTVQRDLRALSRLVALRTTQSSKPYRWQWAGPCPCCGRAALPPQGQAPQAPPAQAQA
jgi:hypothetical protein